ncbi:purine-binding chemotaxis protein CheW [Calothrix sp. FACHB-1219]|uniref:chemotaxis protein CheW n=1 Tax=unclassified Calothrix TaxID=2619626 RepID=UPI001688CCBA|nr:MULTISPECIES: chemotaxis protein CheW [unclassified Calothrix]MBD2206463.1 purine-binding chemotaxis protein CheW [Calothrix sp. FACHB-168]MBD2220340.1 purine-binding chemotaxis protein CheW [Calothrix sp. FACHB-1219]
MLMLLLSVGDDLYAVESAAVVEVIPRVSLRKVHHVPEYVAGLFQYRGAIVPVIDLCHLIRGTPSRFCLSTRIIIVSYPPQERTRQYLGLVAERVTETFNQPQTELIDSGIRVKEAPYLGGILMNEKGIIQYIRLDKLFTVAQNTYLLTAGEG